MMHRQEQAEEAKRRRAKDAGPFTPRPDAVARVIPKPVQPSDVPPSNAIRSDDKTLTSSGEIVAKTIKVTVVLGPQDVLRLHLPAGDHVPITISVAGRRLHARLSAKTVRRAQAAIRTTGLDHVAVILHGRLDPGDVLVEAGISAQPKGPRPQP
jgi:hypothetical protein